MTTFAVSQSVPHEVELNEQHSIGKTIALHLIPGAAGTLSYIILAPIFIQNGYPAILALLVAVAAVILPIELGILLYQARKASGTFSLREILPYRNPLPKWQYVVIPLGLILWGFLATFFTSILDNAIAEAWFSWLPEWFFFSDLSQYEGVARPALMLTFYVYLIVNGVVMPFVEELYFRGYLLPRLERFGKWAPLINLSLFSLYHFWTPWGIISRIIWMTPWVYIVWRKRNIYLIMITHITINAIGSLLTWGLILSQ
ncbi:MAG: CPBP family intramembrane metalloprotease [Anaerolineales bacterium]|jgi:membrane protease YdiL (CAAX protease family)